MSLVSYAKMKAHYESVKPIRGDVNKTRPFMQRRRKWECMKMADNGDIQIICYNTPVLTIHPDDSFSVCHGGWVTPTTGIFIHYALRQMGWREPLAGSFKHKNQLWLTQWWNGRAVRIEGREDHWKRMPITKEPIRYTFNPETNLYNPETNPTAIKTRKRVDKDKWKQAKHQCKEFLQWFEVFGKLLDGQIVEGANSCSISYPVSVCIQYPSTLREKHHWAAKEAKPVLTAIFTESGDEDYLQFVGCLVRQCGNGTYFNFKQQKSQIHNILKNLFDVYYDVKEEVVYTIDRETKW